MLTKPVDLVSLARLILSPECKSIAFLTGAGVSVASGIPDFRSPGGMYDSLRPDLLTATSRERTVMKQERTAVVSWYIFCNNQFPYLEVRRPFILGTAEKKWKATIAHRFMELVHRKTNKLTRIYTQNIDGLDFQCDAIPKENIIPVHGSISQVACEGCGHKGNFDEFCEKLRHNVKDIYGIDEAAPKESSPILCEKCNKPLVKPSTVLFGRNLPMAFFESVENDLSSADLLIIAGTSLVVSPANGVVGMVPKETIRVIVNRDPVGEELGIDYSEDSVRDFFAQGNCDDVFLDLICELEWLQDLAAISDKLPASSAVMVQQRNALKQSSQETNNNI